MLYFNGTEVRSLVLAAGVLLLGAAARLGLAPEPDDFSWTEAAAPPGRPVASLSSVRRLVSDGVTEEETAALPLGADERIDPNTASISQLRRLPGVGLARAQAIVRERTSGGPFDGPADLARVPGIGRKTVEALEDHLAFSPGRSGARSKPGGGPAGPASTRIDVNRAQIKDLEPITGIGPVLAARIVATRQRFGPFERAEDLLRVPGIGPIILQRIRGQVRF